MNTIKANPRILNTSKQRLMYLKMNNFWNEKQNYFQKENFRLNHSHEYNYVSTKL